ncbi:MAG: formamidopyrimidine-DNA glycosylase [Planctomycetota bacterium]
MPELPEVETVVRALRPLLTGRSVNAVRVLNASTVAGSLVPLARLAGLSIQAVERQGKYIWIHGSGERSLVVHLRMTGWLGVLSRAEFDRRADPYVRLTLDLDVKPGAEPDLLVFRDIRKFGRVWGGPTQALAALKSLAKLGPDPLVIEAEAFLKRLRARRGRLKTLLLDQTFLAGVGNIYADEALFRAGIHPLAEAARLSAPRAERLRAAIGEILRRSIEAGGSTISDYYHPDGQPGWFERELRVYGRGGEACLDCGAKIKRIVLGQRSTCFCPKCQRK